MEQVRPFDCLKVQVAAGKCHIGAWVMEEDTVNSRYGQHNGIRSFFLVRQNHSLCSPVVLQALKDKGPQLILSYLSHQADIHPQPLHGQAGICNRPAGMDIHPIHLYQPSGRQNPSRLPCTPLWKQGSDVNTYMSCCHCSLICHHSFPF